MAEAVSYPVGADSCCLPVPPFTTSRHYPALMCCAARTPSGLPVVVSFEMGSPSKHWSFPRRRESSPSAEHFPWLAEWIPAFAGMTALGCAHRRSRPLGVSERDRPRAIRQWGLWPQGRRQRAQTPARPTRWSATNYCNGCGWLTRRGSLRSLPSLRQ